MKGHTSRTMKKNDGVDRGGLGGGRQHGHAYEKNKEENFQRDNKKMKMKMKKGKNRRRRFYNRIENSCKGKKGKSLDKTYKHTDGNFLTL